MHGEMHAETPDMTQSKAKLAAQSGMPTDRQTSYFGPGFQQLELLDQPWVAERMGPWDRLKIASMGAFNAVAPDAMKAAVAGAGDAAVGRVRQLVADVEQAGAPNVSALQQDIRGQEASPPQMRASKGMPAPGATPNPAPARPQRRFFRPGQGIHTNPEMSPYSMLGRRR
jgi:hypothetical protein